MSARQVTALLCLLNFGANLVAAQSETSPSPTEDPSIDEGEFEVLIIQEKTSPTSITVKWTLVNDTGVNVHHFRVETRKEDRQEWLVSAQLDKTRTNYEINDLVSNTKYIICVKAYGSRVGQNGGADDVADDDDNDDDEEGKILLDKTCSKFFTIPYIRVDSVVVFFCIFAYLLLMILIGIALWRRALRKRRAEERAKLMPRDSVVGGGAEDGFQELPPTYTLQPTPLGKEKRMRSSIEDQLDSIPYITTPLAKQKTPDWPEKHRKLRNADL